MAEKSQVGERMIRGACCMIFLWVVGAEATAVPPDPNNAALLYYRAIQLLPEWSADAAASFEAAVSGKEPNESIRKYVQSCRRSIDLVDTAVKMPKCEWNFGASGLPTDPALEASEMLLPARALVADGWVLAADKQYRAALERCLTIRRCAAHLGDDTWMMQGLSNSVDQIARTGIRQILGVMPLDADTLAWLKQQVDHVKGAPLPSSGTLKKLFERDLERRLTDAKTLQKVRQKLVDDANDEESKKWAQSLTNEELAARIRESYARFLDAAFGIMDSNRPYREAYAEIQKLADLPKMKGDSDPVIGLFLSEWEDRVRGTYTWRVTNLAARNILRVAVEIYFETAKTRRLPRRLADDWPTDPLTGEDFEYEITREGFILRHRDAEMAQSGLRPMEFKVRDRRVLDPPGPWDTPAGGTEEDGQESDAWILTIPGEEGGVGYVAGANLEAIIQDGTTPPEVRKRAEAARDRIRTRQGKGFRTLEPFLLRVMLYNEPYIGSVLKLVAYDQDGDLVGVRIREQWGDPNGATPLVEDYPVFVAVPWAWHRRIPVQIRDKGQRKDPVMWEAILIDRIDEMIYNRAPGGSGRRIHALTAEAAVWISVPDPNKVRVFVCVYDRQRHESDYVEVENLLKLRVANPFIDMLEQPSTE